MVTKVKLYGIPNCDTVKKASVWLENKSIPFQFHDFKKDGLETETIVDWLNYMPNQTLINRKSTTFRSLSESDKINLNDDKLAPQIASQNSSIVKRPVLEIDGKIIAVGFDEEEYKNLFSSGK
ncbi:MAG: Spx/MgsR family RNA polymerase-binding regulatory protein [Flavobacteriales bacterium]|nr:Spx/MgsR family RNA polymerase-binding regulatory protein [Flavobacteriales bacterium]